MRHQSNPTDGEPGPRRGASVGRRRGDRKRFDLLLVINGGARRGAPWWRGKRVLTSRTRHAGALGRGVCLGEKAHKRLRRPRTAPGSRNIRQPPVKELRDERSVAGAPVGTDDDPRPSIPRRSTKTATGSVYSGPRKPSQGSVSPA